MVKYFSILFLIFVSWAFNLNHSDPLPEEVAEAYKKLPDNLDFNQFVKPILSDKCFACHGPDQSKQKAGLRLDFSESAYAPLPVHPDLVAITPTSLEKSEVFHRIISTDPTYLMPEPSSHLILSAKEKAILIKWIEEGAIYKPHWAFVKPVKKSLPDVISPTNPIDHFVLDRLKQEDLSIAKEASKEILLRRVSLDLTGLPPTLDEIDAFLSDSSPDNYEKQVDRLLASPHYGEKMAIDWLDLARFADSHGYTVDKFRDMSPYRDWVIKAFNTNMPYDTFIHDQLAGDLMPHPTKEMIISTAFNRNHQQNMEGGIIEQEFQAEYVMDRTNTFGEVFIGLSVGCARCHDHKFDPITQKNYYELFSFFNNVREAGQIAWNNDIPTPTILLPSNEKEKIISFLNGSISKQEQHIEVIKSKAAADFETWVLHENYKTIIHNDIPALGLQGYYDFEDSLINSVNRKDTGVMRFDAGVLGGQVNFVKREKGNALLMDGDTYLDLKDVGVYSKSEPFSVGLWAFIPDDLKEGVIFHKSEAERLYNFKGYHLYLKDDKLEIMMAHTAPSNAITKITKQNVPRNTWIQLTLTYDGSSKAAGFKLLLNGFEMEMETVIDQLYKDIIFHRKVEPALQIGGWWRGLGFKGGKVDDIVIYNRVLTPFEIKVLAKKANWNTIFSKNNNQLTTEDKLTLKDYYFSAIDTNTIRSERVLQKLRTELADSMEYIDELMVMQEMSLPKKSYILQRGQYDAPGEQVFPNTPSTILPFDEGLPKNRYGLAQWLTDNNNPLTARVEVNRLWQNLFGIGLVKTAGDFGNQGEMPGYLDLLDWLSVTFQESNWDIKKLNKLIVMSATYRQDSKTSMDLRARDPENRLLARGPANRLSAEMMRDNALYACGLFNEKLGGKSIKPYQPDGLWEINTMHYTPDSTDNIYRRSLYIIVKRSVPNPTLSTFDAPSRSYCVVRRQSTNTPLQALVTLNDPTFIEVSKVLGEQMTRGSDIAQSISTTYRKLTGQSPTQKEVDLLIELQKNSYQLFKNNPVKARGWLNTGLYKTDIKLDSTMIASNAVVASTILNSDATITKR